MVVCWWCLKTHNWEKRGLFFHDDSLNQVQRGQNEERVYSVTRAPLSTLQHSSLPCSSPGTGSRARKAVRLCLQGRQQRQAHRVCKEHLTVVVGPGPTKDRKILRKSRALPVTLLAAVIRSSFVLTLILNSCQCPEYCEYAMRTSQVAIGCEGWRDLEGHLVGKVTVFSPPPTP